MFDLYTNSVLSKIPDFQLENFWILTFDDLHYFDILVKECSLPLFSLNWEKTGYEMSYPESKGEYSSFTMELYETETFTSYNYYKSWMENMYDFKKRVFKIGALTDKRQAKISYVTYRSSFPIVVNASSCIQYNKTFTLHGLSLNSIGDISPTNDSGNPLTISVEMNVQKISES